MLLDKYPKLASGRYAVIADEAHPSRRLHRLSKLNRFLAVMHPEGEESAPKSCWTPLCSRQPNEAHQLHAFTGYAQAKTLSLFASPADPTLPASSRTSRKRYLYSMRRPSKRVYPRRAAQLTPPLPALPWKIASPQWGGSGRRGDSKKPRHSNWLAGCAMHPYNIDKKVRDHCRSTSAPTSVVCRLWPGKAMVRCQ